MNKKIRTPKLVSNRWVRLGSAIVLACVLLFIPITVQTVIHVPVLPLYESELITKESSVDHHKSAGKITGLPLSFGPALVYATGGLTITKSAPLTITQGSALTYTLTITNNTGNVITSGFVADPLPSDVTCGQEIQSPSNWTFNCSSGTAWTFSPDFGSQPINNGATVELIYTVNVPQQITDGHKIVNSGYQISADGFSDFGPPVTTTVGATAWAITKVASSNTIQPGQTLVYTITATNIGGAATVGTYVITDSLPNDIVPGSVLAPEADDEDASPLTWTFSDSLAGLGVGSKVVTFSVQITSPLANGTKIVNENYTVSGGGADEIAGNPITVTVDSPATLTITKTANPSPVKVDNVLTYTLTVTNNASTGPAQNVVITDTLSNYVSYLSAGFVGGASGTITDAGGNPIIWTLADPLAPNDSAQVTVTVRVSDTLPDPPQITNNFQTSADNAPQVSDSMNVEVEAAAVDVVTLTVNSIANLCGTTVATVTAVDEFNNPVSGASADMAQFSGSGQISPSAASGSTNAAGVFTATFQGVIAGNVSMAASAGGKFDPDGASLTINTGTPIPTSLSLGVSPNPLLAGGSTGVVTATLTDCQAPPQPVDGATVNLSLSDTGLANFLSPPPPPGVTNANGVMTATLVSTSTGSANGTVTITGTSTGSEWDLQDVEILNIDPASAPVLSITKLSDPADGNTVSPGDTIVYNLVVSNSGTAAATGMVITDDLHAGVGFVTGSITPTGSGPVDTGGGVITFTVSSLGIGNSVTATIEVTVTAEISGTVITNTARGSDATGNFGPSNMVSHQVITGTGSSGDVFLPIIIKDS